VTQEPLVLTSEDERYPASLRDLPRPPQTVWAIGNLELLQLPTVAIVGTRRATTSGLRVTRELASAFARAGACVLSGMARGIDGAAHKATLDSGGATCAVLGTGVDVPYPPSHRALHERIAKNGLLLSEMPPGAHSHKGSFINRNRLIAALARLTIVVEAPLGSGALKTAEVASDLGRDYAAVPGPIDVPQNAGSNRLLQHAAHVIGSVADALALMRLTPPVRTMAEPGNEDEARILRVLGRGASDLDTLCHSASLPVSRCLAAVTSLEMRGVIECELTGEIRRR
jgi:DNA processing protein